MAGRSARIPPETVRQIIELHRQGQSVRAIGRRLGVSFSRASEFIRGWKINPDQLELMWGGAPKDDAYHSEVKRLLLEDAAWLHSDVRGWMVHPTMVRGWELQDKHREVLLCAFRGYGKSVAWGETRVIQQVLRSAEAVRLRALKQPHPPHWVPNYSCAYISAIDDQARPHVANVRAFLMRREIIQLFGDFKSAPWGDSEFTIRQRDQDVADPTMLGGGIYSSGWTGKHPDEVIFDDMVTMANVGSLHQLRKLQQQLMLSIEPILRPAAKRSWVNTPYADGDPISIRIAAAEGKGAERDRLPAVIVRALEPTEKDGGHRSAWPERFPVHPTERDGQRLEGLLEKRDKMNRVLPGSFEAQYQMDTSELQQRVLDTGKVHHVHIDTIRARPFVVSQFFDASWSKRPSRRSDFSALATGGFGLDGNFYLLRCVRAKRGPAAIREFIRQEFRLGKDCGWWALPAAVWTEKTGLYAQEVAGLMQELAEIPWRTTLPRGTKEARSISLEYMLDTGRFYVADGTGDWITESRQGERDGMIDEMDAFPAGQFDDRVDAVCQLISVCQRKYGLVGTEQEKAPAAATFGTFKIKR